MNMFEFRARFYETLSVFQMNEIEVCPECYLSACQKRDNWFCEPCVSSTPLINIYE